jgi:hypothetical protein
MSGCLLCGRLCAHNHERAGRRASRWARNRSFINQSHARSAGAAVGRDEHFILVTCRRTGARIAADSDHSHRTRTDRGSFAGTGRSRGTWIAFRPLCARRSRRSRRSRFALFAGRSRRSGFPFWSLAPLTTTCHAKRDRDGGSDPCHYHDLKPHHVRRMRRACNTRSFGAGSAPGSGRRICTRIRLAPRPRPESGQQRCGAP